ncbi:unnamed protein product [Meganyctiphanes norvegica]|uniref:Uncharacterized protein n=1 Tax=Meganyctiphanes norvegica TaxID=48144 RepID=A0AAV2RYG8_MEGNR
MPHPPPPPHHNNINVEPLDVTATMAQGTQSGMGTKENNSRKCKKFKGIREYCQLNIKITNKKHSCGNCKNTFNPKCYKKVSTSDQMCRICPSIELPFYTCDSYREDLFSGSDILEGSHGNSDNNLLEENHINNNADKLEQSLISPSQIPENKFDCFKRRGLHFIHINARSMFHKIMEIRLLAMKIKPAVISITESWLDISQTDESIKIEGYNILRRDRLTHGEGVCAYIRADLAYNPKVELQNVEL